ncbi:MAG TPA: porin family protein [Devosiaceae bacterium]|jgi:outer membrane immunogenic protein|nr:porin family protein [Devosiaceae bacterium]
MRRLLVLATFGATLVVSTGAMAADLIGYSTSTDKSLPVTTASPGYDWSGFYAGVFGAYQKSAASGDALGGGVDLGVNTTFNFVLAGAEVAVVGLDNGAGATPYVQGIGRAGVLLTDNLVAYGAAGFGLDPNAGAGDVLAGGGLEYAVTDALSLRAQYLHGFPTSGSDAKDQFTLGAQFHF